MDGQDEVGLQGVAASDNGFLLVRIFGPSGFVAEADFAGERGEADVGVVVAEQEAMLGAGGEHSVGVVDAFGGEVVDHDADEAGGAGEVDGGLFLGLAGGVDAGDDALSGGFFVAAGAVNLSGEEEAGEVLAHEVRRELEGVGHVVFDGVAGAEHLHVFQSDYRAEELDLDGGGEGGGDSLDVDFLAGPGFAFEPDGVFVFVGESDDFVFDAGAVAGADAFDAAAVHGGFAEVGADEVVGALVGAGLPAGEEVVERLDRVVEEAEGAGFGLAGFFVGLGEIDAGEADAGGGTGFESAHVDAEIAEGG